MSINIPDNQVTECDWWDDHKITQLPDTIDIKDENKLNEALASPTSRKIIIGAVPCQHFSGRSGFDNNETLWAGWVVKSSDASYYFAG